MSFTPAAIGNMTLVFKVFRRLGKMLSNPKELLLAVNRKREALFDAELNSLWSGQDYILSQMEYFTPAFYGAHKGIPEIEHQIGRYLNMRNICDEIVADGIEGDIVEFGTWQGLGLILLSDCFSSDRTERKLIGIDSFEGLPESSTI